MKEHAISADTPLTRNEASTAVESLGWRYILGVLRTAVPVDSVSQAADVAAHAVRAAGTYANGHVWADVRRDRVILTVQSRAAAAVTRRDTELAHAISHAVSALGRRTAPDVAGDGTRSVQVIEIAIDALDIPSVRPFWKAVLGYADEADAAGPTDPLVDPLGEGPAIWFQQMDAPRPQRNRVHLDVSVPHDEARRRLASALSAGGVLVDDSRAPAFWVLADAERNEACITTWQGRGD